MSAYIRGGTLAPVFHHRLFGSTFVQKADVQRMVAQLVSHPSVAEAERHVQHWHNAVHQPFTFVAQKAEVCIGNNP